MIREPIFFLALLYLFCYGLDVFLLGCMKNLSRDNYNNEHYYYNIIMIIL